MTASAPVPPEARDVVRIVQTCHRCLPAPGGTESAVGWLAAALARQGHEVTVATSLHDGLPPDEVQDGVRVRRFPLRRLGRFRVPPRAYAAFVCSGEFDAVHLHGQRVWSTDFLHGALRRAGRAYVFTPHGLHQRHVEDGALNRAYERWVFGPALRRAARVVALTESQAQEIRAFGVRAERVVLLPPGLDPRETPAPTDGLRGRLGIAAGERVLLSVGGLYPHKRVDRVVRAAAELGPGVRVVAIGAEPDPRERQRVERLARDLAVPFTAAGVLPRGDVLAAYRVADLLVLASTWEGYGIALLEAMAAGLPFVATPVGAAPSLAATGAGVVAGHDPSSLARAARALLADPVARRVAGEAGRRAVLDLDIDRVAQEHVRIYEDALRGAARR